jgi:hypothetical protein
MGELKERSNDTKGTKERKYERNYEQPISKRTSSSDVPF